MWAIKFLSGPKAGQEVLLQKGLVVLGRDESCQIVISINGISKKHAQITVTDTAVEIEDLNSSNGTFFNGKKIKFQKLEAKDRIALHDVIFEVIRKNHQEVHPYFQPYLYPQNYNQQSMPNQNAHNEGMGFQDSSKQKKDLNFQNIEKGMKGYIHNVVLPGVYKLAEWLEFKWVVGFFLIGFIFLVMALSSIPLIQILKSSVEQESRNHAESIAVTLSKINRDNLKLGLHAALDVDYALKRPGVEKAYIISAVDGRILSPSELSHTYPKQSFIHKARKLDKSTIEKVGSSIGAVVPIRFYNAKSGENAPVAYSVVLYDTGSLAVGGAKILSLLIQNLFIACVLGLIVFFLLINLIEFPIRSISHQLNEALKNNKSSAISTSYQSSILKELCSHINSALNQLSLNQILKTTDVEEEVDNTDVNRQSEMNNLVEIVGFPCLSINLADETIASINSNFTEQIGFNDILHSPISDIGDSDLKEHLQMLIGQGHANPEELSFGEINIKNMTVQTTCQFIMGKKDPAYAIITFMNAEEEVA